MLCAYFGKYFLKKSLIQDIRLIVNIYFGGAGRGIGGRLVTLH